MGKTMAQRLLDAGEFFAAGLYEYPERSSLYRHSNAMKRFWERAELTPYEGGKLYPCGRSLDKTQENLAVWPQYSYTYQVNHGLMKEKFGGDAEIYDEIMEQERRLYEPFSGTPHTVGGAGWTHSFINYERILKDGFCGYRARVQALPEGDFRDSMLLVLDGIDTYRSRLVQYLKEQEKVYPGLIEALEHTNEPPRTLYEAVVLWNFAFYVDGCDDIGRMDKHLYRFWNGEDIVDLLHEMYVNIDRNDAWSGALGPDYNELTLQCIRASHYIRRPSLQLRIRPDMPDEVWQEVYASLATSCGQPALYNEEGFQASIAREFPEIPAEDRERCVFGGCTETMLEGMSNVGSDDSGLNSALVYDRFTRAHLAEYDTFEGYFNGLCSEMQAEILDTLERLTRYRKVRAEIRPQPVRTLLIDDCIDKMQDFNAGGARYNWSVSNVAGLINVIDSISVVRELVFEKKLYTAETFLAALDAQDPEFLRLARECPCFGVDDERIDLLAAELAHRIYDGYNQLPCWPSGKYLTVSNQFNTYAGAGLGVMATPDGRNNAEPLCDSLGSVHGKDVDGPTALLNSVSTLPLSRVMGTPVMNIRMRKEHLSTILKPLVLAFFERGGMQLQVTCASREEMLDALEHPEKHENLIVRIGGFSEYFNRLSPVLKQTVIDRTEH